VEADLEPLPNIDELCAQIKKEFDSRDTEEAIARKWKKEKVTPREGSMKSIDAIYHELKRVFVDDTFSEILEDDVSNISCRQKNASQSASINY
jgi:hypothetical protein